MVVFYVSLRPSVCLPVCLPACLSVCLSLSVCQPVCPLFLAFLSHGVYRLVGLAVKESASSEVDQKFDSRLRPEFDAHIKTGALVTTLPVAPRYRNSAGTGWPGVRIL